MQAFTGFFEIVIVTLHLFRCCPQLKLFLSSKLYVRKTSLLPCLSLSSFLCSVFKVQLLFRRLDQRKMDYMSRCARHVIVFPTAFAVRFEDPNSMLGSSNPAAICLVGPSGLEPPTLRLSVVRSSQLSYGPLYGGDSRDRTGDLLLARQALSQLSYIPILSSRTPILHRVCLLN